MAKITIAVELMVKLTLTFSKEISLNKVYISSTVSMATPTLPTSSSISGQSESKPNWVGRSRATLKPVCPWLNKYLYL